MIVYCISGLGADERVFARLKLQATLRHIQWIKPERNESIHHYCKRLAEQIDASRPFILLGVSFGGLIARELAQLVPAQRVIIISSFSSESSLPALARLPLLASLPGLLPNKLLVPPHWLMFWLFGLDSPQERQLLKEILRETDPVFLRWALHTLLRLKGIPAVPCLLHIHGTADRLIACPKSSEVVKLVKGSHFLIYSRAGEVSALINRFLNA